MRSRRVAFVVTAVVWSLLGTGCARRLQRLEDRSVCVPGTTAECQCTGATGLQVCLQDASGYGECSCERTLTLVEAPPTVVGAGEAFALAVSVLRSDGSVREEERGLVQLQLLGAGRLDGVLSGPLTEGYLRLSGLTLDTLQAGATLAIRWQGRTLETHAIEVRAGAPAALAWVTEPVAPLFSGVPSRHPIALELRDAFGNPAAPTASFAISLATTAAEVAPEPALVVASETRTQVDNLKLSGSGDGLQLVASAAGLASAISAPFSVQASDPEWASGAMPDSATAFCGDGVDHTDSDCAALASRADLQDGNLARPAARVDGLNGLLYDRVTGLVWQTPNAAAEVVGLAEARQHCANLGTAGLVWRLPTVAECVSLHDYGSVVFEERYFFTETVNVDAPPNVWAFSVHGFAYPMLNSAIANEPDARCVSGPPLLTAAAPGAPNGQYGPLGIGDVVVRDVRTGLEWQRAQSTTGVTLWADALSQCDALGLGGADDWRLPTIKELQTIMDMRGRNPAMDSLAFPSSGGAIAWWSSTALRVWALPHTPPDPDPEPFRNNVWVMNAVDARMQVVSASDGRLEFVGAPALRQAPHVKCVRGPL